MRVSLLCEGGGRQASERVTLALLSVSHRVYDDVTYVYDDVTLALLSVSHRAPVRWCVTRNRGGGGSPSPPTGEERGGRSPSPIVL